MQIPAAIQGSLRRLNLTPNTSTPIHSQEFNWGDWGNGGWDNTPDPWDNWGDGPVWENWLDSAVSQNELLS